jgi:hypothetical protein
MNRPPTPQVEESLILSAITGVDELTKLVRRMQCQGVDERERKLAELRLQHYKSLAKERLRPVVNAWVATELDDAEVGRKVLVSKRDHQEYTVCRLGEAVFIANLERGVAVGGPEGEGQDGLNALFQLPEADYEAYADLYEEREKVAGELRGHRHSGSV